MQQQHHERFHELISTWLRSRGMPVDAQILGFWLAALSHLTIDEIAQGVKKAVQDTEHGMYPPSPAHVLRHVVRKPEYHHKQELPDIAPGSGMAGILGHLESKQASDSIGREWIDHIRANLERIGRGERRTLEQINHDRHVLGLKAWTEADHKRSVRAQEERSA